MHLRRGDVVAIPTEALYMLVADPLNLNAVGRVFTAKGREIHRSLPLLISGVFMAESMAKELSTRFHLLARQKEMKVNITVVATKTFMAGLGLSTDVAIIQRNVNIPWKCF